MKLLAQLLDRAVATIPPDLHGRVVVFGSAPMVFAGLKPDVTFDLDLFVDDPTYRKLRRRPRGAAALGRASVGSQPVPGAQWTERRSPPSYSWTMAIKPDGFRDELTAAHERIAQLEAQLAQKAVVPAVPCVGDDLTTWRIGPLQYSGLRFSVRIREGLNQLRRETPGKNIREKLREQDAIGLLLEVAGAVTSFTILPPLLVLVGFLMDVADAPLKLWRGLRWRPKTPAR